MQGSRILTFENDPFTLFSPDFLGHFVKFYDIFDFRIEFMTFLGFYDAWEPCKWYRPIQHQNIHKPGAFYILKKIQGSQASKNSKNVINSTLKPKMS